jgi:hypothetical protein
LLLLFCCGGRPHCLHSLRLLKFTVLQLPQSQSPGFLFLQERVRKDGEIRRTDTTFGIVGPHTEDLFTSNPFFIVTIIDTPFQFRLGLLIFGLPSFLRHSSEMGDPRKG